MTTPKRKSTSRRAYMNRPGQGLDWDAIREEYRKTATPEELNGPFDEDGSLKRGKQDKLNEEAVEAQEASNNRKSRAKKGALTPKQKGALASKPNRIPDEIRRAAAVLYREGLSFRTIAERLGVVHESIRQALVQDGVHVPNRTSGKAGSES